MIERKGGSQKYCIECNLKHNLGHYSKKELKIKNDRNKGLNVGESWNRRLDDE